MIRLKRNNWSRKTLILVLFSTASILTSAQSDTLTTEKPTLTVSGFLDVFYAYDFNKPEGNSRLPFVFNHNRHNEFNLNLGLISLNLDDDKYRANIALQSGTYASDNYSAEQGVFKNVFQANVGIAINKRNNLWLDVGIMPSHLGFENAISTENYTLTRSLLAESSPYFLSGAKLTWNPSEKMEFAALVVNGWQRIKRLSGNSLPSFGTQITYTPSEKIILNWSTFIGTDAPDSLRTMRYFNNIYGKAQLTKKLRLIVGFDIGTQQKSKGSTTYDVWFSPILIAQYSVNDRWSIGARFEHYNDENGVIISTVSENNFRTTGASINLDYSPSPLVTCRIEGRLLLDEDDIYTEGSMFTNQNVLIAGSIAINFSQVISK